MKKSCKSQISIMVIISLLIILAVGGGIYFAGKNGKSASSGTLKDIAQAIKESNQDCFDELFIEATGKFGFDEAKLKDYLFSGFKNCLDSITKDYNKEYELDFEIEDIKVLIDEKEINSQVLGKLNIMKGEDSSSIELPKILIKRTISKELNHNLDCVISNNAGLISFDGKFEIKVLAGTKAVDEKGDCVDEITLTIDDPIIDYGDRGASLTKLFYYPGPFGAKFDKNVELKLKYTNREYNDYISSVIKNLGGYLISESNLRIWYYDPKNGNFYIYPALNPLKNEVNLGKKIIEAYVNQFYGEKLAFNEDCILDKTSIIESNDRRVQFMLLEGTKATLGGECTRDIQILRSAKLSKVVNFGFSDYHITPKGTEFTPSAGLVYRYAQQEINDPKFLYGWKDWQNLIDDTWVSPLNDTSPQILLLSPEDNANSKEEINFEFELKDDSLLTKCSLYIDGIKKNTITAIPEQKSVISQALKEGIYYWYIQCYDGYQMTVSETRNIEVKSDSVISFTGAVIKTSFGNIDNAITGMTIVSGNSPLVEKARSPKDLRMAYLDANGIYRPLKTKVDTKNRRIIALVEKIYGSESKKSVVTGNVITGFWSKPGDDTPAPGPTTQEKIEAKKAEEDASVKRVDSYEEYDDEEEEEGSIVAAEGCGDRIWGAVVPFAEIPVDGCEGSSEPCDASCQSEEAEFKFTIFKTNACLNNKGDVAYVIYPSIGDSKSFEDRSIKDYEVTLLGKVTNTDLSAEEESCAFSKLFFTVKGIGVESETGFQEIDYAEFSKARNEVSGHYVTTISVFDTGELPGGELEEEEEEEEEEEAEEEEEEEVDEEEVEEEVAEEIEEEAAEKAKLPGEFLTEKINDSEGNQREYYLYVPSSYSSSNSYPLLFYFIGSSHTVYGKDTGFRELAESNNFIFVAPDTFYNTGDLVQWVRAQQVDNNFVDEQLVLDILYALSNKYNINRSRIYSTGFSNGAYFTNLMAMRYSDTFVAIAPHSGGLPPASNVNLSQVPNKYYVKFFEEENNNVGHTDLVNAIAAYQGAGFEVSFSREGNGAHSWDKEKAVKIWEFLSSKSL